MGKRNGVSTGRFDFSGVDVFWGLVDRLRAGHPPEDHAWDVLFRTPGYRALTVSEFPSKFFVRRMLAAYDPHCAEFRDELEMSGDRFLRHFIEAGERRVELADLRSRLAAEEATIMRRAYDRALRFLPPGEYPPPPDVSFVVFGPDARGYVPVVVDILYAAGLGGGLWPLIAHETHHQLVSAVRGLGIGQGGYSRSDLQWVLDQIHLEGVADAVSDLPGTGAVSWLKPELPAVPDYLEFLDGQLSILASRPEKCAEVGSLLRSRLRAAGHPVGFFMATTILNQLGEPVLAAAATDPGDFFAAYVLAARKAGLTRGAGLSEESANLIASIV